MLTRPRQQTGVGRSVRPVSSLVADSAGACLEDGEIDRVAVRVTADDEVVVLCQDDHLPLSFRKVILDGTGLEEVTCRGSTVKGHAFRADKLLIKPRRVDQDGVGHTRDGTNARHAYRRP